MYTRCPECLTWFKVSEEQLGTAAGRVRCGQCFVSFDAASRLWAEPDEESARVPWTAADPETDPQAEAGGEGEASGAEAPASPPGLPDGPGPGAPFDPLRGAPSEDGRGLSSVAAGDVGMAIGLEPEPAGPRIGDVRRLSGDAGPAGRATRRIQEGRIAARRRRNRERALLNRIDSRVDRTSGRRSRRRGRWAAPSCAGLLLLAVLQYTWVMAGDLATAFPGLGAAIDRFCAVTGCRTGPRDSLNGVRVAASRMRPHPEYMSAVSVDATLENRADAPRPFPVVVFVLYGRDGRTIASRAFEPAEYIDGGAVPPEGMGAGSRVDIGFDVVIPSEAAVSFDLRLA